MKKYNTDFIKKYIEEHKSEIDTITCGMREYWNWSSRAVYFNGEYSSRYNWGGGSISVVGMSGSVWATPVMEVKFKGGRTEVVECFADDGEKENPDIIAKIKTVAVATGGMYCI